MSERSGSSSPMESDLVKGTMIYRNDSSNEIGKLPSVQVYSRGKTEAELISS